MPAREIEAASAQAAAEQVCGAPLSSTGLQGKMCAQVWPIGWADKKVLFYRPVDGEIRQTKAAVARLMAEREAKRKAG